MKKNKIENKKRSTVSPVAISPTQAADFLENFRLMQSGIDKKTKAISLRVPENILEAYKLLAKSEQRAYQNMMIEALRNYLNKARESKNHS